MTIRFSNQIVAELIQPFRAERTSGGRLRVEPLQHAHALESEG
jgi:hypothetical protein